MNKKVIFTLFSIITSLQFINAQIRVSPGGNVVIGTSNSPYGGFKFQVIGHSVFSNSTAAPQSAAFIRGLNSFSGATNPDYTWWGNDQVGIFHPDYNIIGFSTGGQERMRITGLGSLLIGGTFDSDCKLSTDATNKSNQINYSNYSTNYGYAEVSNVNNPTTKSWIVTYNWQERFSILGNGAAIGLGGFWTPSDRTLKENIDTIGGALSKIMKLRGMRYNYKPEKLKSGDTTTILPTGDPRKFLGIIAQELEPVVPEAVMTTSDGKKAVCYDQLIPLLLEGIKTQQKKIDDLQSQVNTLLKSKLPNLRQLSSSTTSDNMNASAVLYQNIPNPFNEGTTIKYYLPDESTNANLLILNLQGKLIKKYPLQKGNNSISIQGNELDPGIYLYSMIVNNQEIDSKKMILAGN